MSWEDRTALVIGKDGTARLHDARVAVLGLGGVGGAAAEALVRAGIGHLLLVDGDTFDETNLNRQILSDISCIGDDKITAAEKRFRDINPDADITYLKEFYLPDNCAFLYDWKPDYIIDAIDTVTAKLDIAEKAAKSGTRLISCLGTGNRLDPGKFRIGDISETAGCGCPLARVIRHEAKKRGIGALTVLYSTEDPVKASLDSGEGKHSPGSISFVPPVAGYMIAGKCIRDLIGAEQK